MPLWSQLLPLGEVVCIFAVDWDQIGAPISTLPLCLAQGLFFGGRFVAVPGALVTRPPLGAIQRSAQIFIDQIWIGSISGIDRVFPETANKAALPRTIVV